MSKSEQLSRSEAIGFILGGVTIGTLILVLDEFEKENINTDCTPQEFAKCFLNSTLKSIAYTGAAFFTASIIIKILN
jgi:hypothetical protein